MDNERVALLVIRVRTEPGSPSPLRANVRLTEDTRRGFTFEVNLADADDVAATVRQWLRGLLGDEDGPCECGVRAEPQ